MLFSGLTKFLLFIPVIGNVISTVSGWAGMILGLIVGVLTIALAFFTSQPLIMFALIAFIVIILYFLTKNAHKKQQQFKDQLGNELGYSPSDEELKELEYIKLWQLFAGDEDISENEQKRLDVWAKRNRFSLTKVDSLTQRAKKELSQKNDQLDSLKQLIKLSLADGSIDKRELKTLRQAASFNGLHGRELSKLINQVKEA